MKKSILSLLSVALFASTVFVTGCKKDDAEATPVPSVVFVTPAGGTTTVSLGQEVQVKLVASANVKLKSLGLSLSIDGSAYTSLGDTVFASSINSYTIDELLPSKATAGTVDYKFTVTDKDGNVGSAILHIIVTATSANLETYTAKLLGDYKNSASGSFFSTSTGSVYNQADAKSNASKVDFVYFYGATNKGTIASPNDADAKSIYNNSTTGIQAWTVQNATVFSDASSIDFATATEAEITSATSSSSASKLSMLAIGSVGAFKTVSGKSGIFKVSALNVGTNNNGSITIDVKVQK